MQITAFWVIYLLRWQVPQLGPEFLLFHVTHKLLVFIAIVNSTTCYGTPLAEGN